MTFLGHLIDRNGVHIAPEKVKAVVEWPEPSNVSQVCSFLGFVNFFHNSLCRFAEVAEPLTRLTHSDVVWQWTEREQAAFNQIKQLITTAPCLALVDLADS